ncbi:MAG: CTP-dependent riboflavin kinase [Candidatus Bathyarchaeota archaeon]|nr:CTP-dependent riboflavin kinase [Candidatus Bathyarchaeota archaeon]
MKRIKLTGKVFSGTGEGRKYLTLPWVKQQIEKKLGFTPYPGTLNILLSEESARRKKLLEIADAMKIHPADGYCSGLLHKASIEDVECAIVIPEVAGYPRDYLEVIAADYLRARLQLKDGDTVTVTANL